jgi:glycosyltransferase involved in cell wall biosynthesis
MKVSIVIPAHNEEDSIALTIQSVLDRVTVPYELIVVADHCSDKTEEIANGFAAKNPHVRVTRNETLKGSFSNSILAGLALATGDAFVPVMADNCDDPATINTMAMKLSEGFDVVCASRYIKGGKKIGGPWIQDKLSRIVCYTLKLFTGVPTWDAANSYKMYRMTSLKTLKYDIPNAGTEYSMAVLFKAYFAGLKITEVPSTWRGQSIPLKQEGLIFKRFPNYWFWYRRAVSKMIKPKE